MKNKIHFIFDTETNGFGDVDLLSISYIICKNDKILHKETRYYFTQEPYNYHAFKVHGLDAYSIKKRRGNSSYPLYFDDDTKWLVGVFSQYNVENIVAHNLSFDAKFLPQEIKNKIENNNYSTFCTMQKNRHITSTNKAPKLKEACEIYGIDFDEFKAHNSDYDTLKCFEVFLKSI